MMNEEQQDNFFDLLAKKAVSGLDDAERRELDQIFYDGEEGELLSLEMTAAAIAMTDVDLQEKMPDHLAARIASDADRWVGAGASAQEQPEAATGGGSWFSWLGWIAAAAACVALAANIYFTRVPQPQIAQGPVPVQSPTEPSPGVERDEMLRSVPGLIKADWAAGNMKELKAVSGDVVWSDEKQAGYMRLRGLPVNDKTKETYQLWIFDKTQDKATPIDGGTFDIAADGDVIVPIDAKIRAEGPTMFAITLERPGGVVVSKREKIAALATVETRSTS